MYFGFRLVLNFASVFFDIFEHFCLHIPLPYYVNTFQIYLYISGKNVTGFLSACRIKEAHRLLPPLSSQFDDPKLPALCSEESFPAKCGVTRLWVSPTARKRGIAKAMMDALR